MEELPLTHTADNFLLMLEQERGSISYDHLIMSVLDHYYQYLTNSDKRKEHENKVKNYGKKIILANTPSNTDLSSIRCLFDELFSYIPVDNVRLPRLKSRFSNKCIIIKLDKGYFVNWYLKITVMHDETNYIVCISKNLLPANHKQYCLIDNYLFGCTLTDCLQHTCSCTEYIRCHLVGNQTDEIATKKKKHIFSINKCILL